MREHAPHSKEEWIFTIIVILALSAGTCALINELGVDFSPEATPLPPGVKEAVISWIVTL